MRLENKTTLVTGASKVMGESEARLFASQAATVVLCDVVEREGKKTAKMEKNGKKGRKLAKNRQKKGKKGPKINQISQPVYERKQEIQIELQKKRNTI